MLLNASPVILKDHLTVMAILTAFLREMSKKRREDVSNEDIKAVSKVIGRRTWLEFEAESQRILNLSGVILIDCEFIRANLAGANLREADLGEANLRWANLIETDLGDANLSGADLSGANLLNANLDGADLREAFLYDATLEEYYKNKGDSDKALNVTLEQILATKNFESAILPPDLEQELMKYLSKQPSISQNPKTPVL